MKFEEVYGRARRGVLSQAEAAEVLGMSERNFRRWRTRWEAEGVEGLYDRRLGRVSVRRAAVDEVMAVLELLDTRYWEWLCENAGASYRGAERRPIMPSSSGLLRLQVTGAKGRAVRVGRSGF